MQGFSCDSANSSEQSLDQNDQNQYRKDELEVRPDGGRQLRALPLVALCEVVIEAPAPAAHTEQKVDERTGRKQEV